MLIPLPELMRRGLVDPGKVLHIGAHAGEEGAAYQKYMRSSCWWVEANERLLPKLRSAVANFTPPHYVVHALVLDTPQPSKLWIANNGQSSSVLELGTHAIEHPTVWYEGYIEMDATTVDQLWAEGKIQPAPFVNIDVQGAELLVLKGMENYLAHVSTLYLEINEKELYKDCALLPDVEEWLWPRGFERRALKMLRHGWGDAVWVRRA